MTKHTQTCKACGKESTGELYHLGFSDMDCMYCDSCPNVLLLTDPEILERNEIQWPHLQPGDDGWEYYDRHLVPTYERIERLFKPCHCGGRFRAWALPRCPNCNEFIFGAEPQQDKPVTWKHRYVFVTVGSVADKDHLGENAA